MSSRKTAIALHTASMDCSAAPIMNIKGVTSKSEARSTVFGMHHWQTQGAVIRIIACMQNKGHIRYMNGCNHQQTNIPQPKTGASVCIKQKSRGTMNSNNRQKASRRGARGQLSCVPEAVLHYHRVTLTWLRMKDLPCLALPHTATTPTGPLTLCRALIAAGSTTKRPLSSQYSKRSGWATSPACLAAIVEGLPGVRLGGTTVLLAEPAGGPDLPHPNIRPSTNGPLQKFELIPTQSARGQEGTNHNWT